MKNKYQINSFENNELLSEALCERIIAEILNAIHIKGKAYLAFSGGNTPKKMFEKLSNVDIPWNKVIITLVDERWVETYDIKSNENLLTQYLLQNHAKMAQFISLKNAAIRASDGVKITQNRLKAIETFDVVILGMGDDAHTASFFPHATELKTAFDTTERCCASTATVEPYERMTLSRKFLLTTKTLILHIEGKNKKEVFDKACQNHDMFSMPIISMMQQEKPILEVYYG